MDQDVRVRDRRVEERWRRPEFVAAVLNGALILVAPTVWAAHADYTWDAVRPYQPTLLSSTVNALPVLVGFGPVALLVAWRTYVHATAYRLNPITVWRGPLESAGIAGALALMVMLVATAATWVREPFQLVIAYIAFYAIATALVGLVLGLVLAATALLALHIMRLAVGRQAA